MCRLITAFFLQCIMVGTASAACTLTVVPAAPTVLATDVISPLTTLSPNTLSFQITCPVGQAWSLSAVLGASSPRTYVYAADSKYVDNWICRPGFATCSGASGALLDGSIIATGTGTGAVQTAQLYMAGSYTTMAYTYSGDVALGSALKVQNYGPTATPSTWFKLVGDVTVSSGANITYNVQQSCKIASTTSWTAAFTGAADVTGSFGVKHICGYGTSVPAIYLRIGGGNNPAGEVRRAAKTGSGYIYYRLYQDSAYTSELGVTASNTLSLPTATSSYGTKTIYGKIRKDDVHTVSGNGAYTDVVTEILEF